ncbi:Carbon-nitrogen hydrolase [Robiginitalea myxolifaciens]|uniref:Omega-amidase YafV n=1 Tax=Robiginitalea myxolifaciens TaxID=400055 RepID=A0A1I6G6S1_9FLAO|nr:amidohydrolase [Robiginitalea myxolifaciens]SFR37889.1 Carbon-nitrogen hydrolase [Robiginitalea myxolifaciens]
MKLHLALLQSDLVWESPDKNLENFDRMLAAVSEQTDLVVLPEMFSTGFTMNPERVERDAAARTLEWMRDRAASMNIALAGSLVWPLETGYANRFIFMCPDGQFHFYDKRHTFTLTGEHKAYKSGDQKVVWQYKGFRICPQICYDLRFPVFSRNTEDYDLLLYVANWPEPRVLAWDTLLRARAIENMAYVVGVNRLGNDQNGLTFIGHTSAYNALGEQLAYSEQQEVVSVSLDREKLLEIRQKLPFLNDRDSFTPGW